MGIGDICDPKGVGKELWRFRGFKIIKGREKFVSTPGHHKAWRTPLRQGPGEAQG